MKAFRVWLGNMSSPCYAGVDPGSKGAVAFIWPETYELAVYNLPTYKVTGSARTHTYCDGEGLADLLRKHAPQAGHLEKVHYMPGDGGMGSFTFGDNFGTIKGVFAGVGIKLDQVPPQTWKAALRVPADKGLAVKRAKALFLACTELFTRPDRAEAAMICLYGVLMRGHILKGKFQIRS